MAHFRRRRLAELAPLITSALLEELVRNPMGAKGHQSDALSQVLNFVRTETPMSERAFVYVDSRGGTYRLARMRGRGERPDFATTTFPTEADAVAAVVLERLGVLGLMRDLGAKP